LWFVQVLPYILYYPNVEVSQGKREKIGSVLTRWGAKSPRGPLAVADFDSMELVEFVMEIEKILEVPLTQEVVRDFKSLADLIDFFVRECAE